MRYVAVSGGADSTAMALLLHERGENFEMVFSDTGAELPEVYWMLPKLAETVGKKLHVVSGGSFFQHLVSYGYLLPAPRVRWCTRVLKQAPQDRYFKGVGAEEVCVGIRADEPQRLYDKTRPRAGKYRSIYPLANAGMGKKDVLRLCGKYDLLNPAYQWRTNVSCFCCFFQRKRDWLGLAKHHPDLFRVAEMWEEMSQKQTEKGFTWRRGHTLKHLREADEAQLLLWPEPEEEPCVICTA